MAARSAESVYGALVERIVSGRLRPGETLDDETVRVEFPVSPAMIRTALKRLTEAGLAERDPRRGIVVRQLDSGDIAELFEAVAEVESAIAALAAMRMSVAERRRILDLVEAGEGARDDAHAYGEINARFHASIREGGHNAILAATLEDMNLKTLPWRAAQFSADTRRRSTSRDEHREIVAAILDRDPDGAREAMRRHIASSFFTLSALLAAPEC